MGAAQIAILIAQYGIPFVEYLIGLIKNKTEVTPAEWANLKALAGVSGKSELLARLQANGIEPTSQLGASLLALVSDSVFASPAPVTVQSHSPDAAPLPDNPTHS